jgi:hypothetical protein
LTHLNLGVFRVIPRPSIALGPSGSSLGLHSETGSRFLVCSPCRRCVRFARPHLMTAHPTGAGRWLAPLRLLRFTRPSGDVTTGTRLLGSMLPTRLPPVGFLNPAAVCDTSGSPVLFHTGNTYGIQRTRTARCFPHGPDRSILRQSRSGSRGPDLPTTRKLPARLHRIVDSNAHACSPEPGARTLTVDVSLTGKAASNPTGRAQ